MQRVGREYYPRIHNAFQTHIIMQREKDMIICRESGFDALLPWVTVRLIGCSVHTQSHDYLVVGEKHLFYLMFFLSCSLSCAFGINFASSV
jgi:hypothetical protein